MAHLYHYAEGWFRAEKRVTELWSAERAEQAHEARKLYTVIVGDVNRPSAFLEVNGRFVGIGFLDEHLREYLSYGFLETEPGKVFLKQATHREFVGESDKVSKGTTYVFKPDGHVAIRREQLDPYKLEEAQSSADVSANYDAYPEFGSYEHLLRKERNPGD
jgi:hypothetical protein